MSFFHFNVIPSFECHFVILMSFRHLNVIPSFECHSIIWMTFHHLNVISLAISQGGNIQSFGCHSIHPIVIWGVEMTGDENILEWQEWWWNDVLIIWKTFPSFLSSQMSGQNWGNCRFHPCHPESSHHSSVIQKFWINGKMPQMTSEWRMIFGYVWPLSLSTDDSSLILKSEIADMPVAYYAKATAANANANATAALRLNHSFCCSQ